MRWRSTRSPFDRLARAAEAVDAVLCITGPTSSSTATATEPYGEEARPSPRSTYGLSKLLGDWLALDAPRGFVLRVESLFGSVRGPAPPGADRSMRSSRRWNRGERASGLHRSRRVAVVRRRRRSRDEASGRHARAARAVSLCEFGPRDVVRGG